MNYLPFVLCGRLQSFRKLRMQPEELSMKSPKVAFRAGHENYSGRIDGDALKLERTVEFYPRRPKPVGRPETARPAVGPAPDGSDPSRSPLSSPPEPSQVVLFRAQR